MSIGSALKFEKSWLGDIWKGIKKDPKRLVLGVDPLSTKGWNAILGRHDKPIVGDFGGPTKDAYANAQAKGINTGTASTLHGAAKAVAGALGGYYAAPGIGNAVGAGGGAGTAAVPGVISEGGAIGGGASAIPEVVVTGSQGAGIGGGIGAGAGVGASASSGDSNSFNWKKLIGKGMGQQQQQQPQQNDWLAEMLREQEKQRQAALARQQLATLLAQQSMLQRQPGVTYGPPPT